jgi:lipopolysaccharide export system protein LptA
MISRKRRFYLLLVFIAGICAGGIAVYLHNRPNSPVSANIGKFYQQIRSRILIRGFKFTGYNEKGEKVITVRADKFSVEKKKLGFITTSLLNVAVIKNARIDMYGRENVSENSTAADLKEQLSGLTFEDSFSRDALPALPAKNISSIKIQPVSLNLYKVDSLVTGISADSAEMRIKQRAMVFKGNVKVVSGEKALTTDNLLFFPEKARISAAGHYILKTKDGTSEGTKFSSDIFLVPEMASKDAKSGNKLN